MTLLKVEDIRARANQEPAIRLFKKTAESILDDLVDDYEEDECTYDIFLSHPDLDAELVLGTKLTLEDYGYSVYAEWVDDPPMYRSEVTKAGLGAIRTRLDSCRSLLFLTTASSVDSIWLPWMLGYMNGRSETAGILALASGDQKSFSGTGYLDLYPYVMGYQDDDGVERLWIHRSDGMYHWKLGGWLNGVEPMRVVR